MQLSTIIYILIALVIVILIFYYFWYLRNGSDDSNDYKDIIDLNDNLTLDKLFIKVCKKYDNYHVFHNKDYITYNKLYKKAKNFGKRLLLHYGSDNKVIIVSDNCPELYYSYFGCILSGNIPIILDSDISHDLLKNIIDTTSSNLLITKDINQDINIKNVITIKASDKYQSFDNFMDSPINASIVSSKKINLNDTATIIYNNNDGVVLTHGNIISAISIYFHTLRSRSNINIGIKQKFVLLNDYPLNTSMSQLLNIYIPIISGSVIYFIDNINLIKDISPTILTGPFKMWKGFMNEIKDKQIDPHNILNKLYTNKVILNNMGLGKCKYCLITDPVTDPVSDQDTDPDTDPVNELIKSFKDYGLELCVCLGLDETCGLISFGVPGCSKNMGTPVINIKFDDKTNEILVKGNIVFNEYYKNPDKTKNMFINRWFKTGIKGYINRDGSLINSHQLSY